MIGPRPDCARLPSLRSQDIYCSLWPYSVSLPLRGQRGAAKRPPFPSHRLLRHLEAGRIVARWRSNFKGRVAALCRLGSLSYRLPKVFLEMMQARGELAEEGEGDSRILHNNAAQVLSAEPQEDALY